MNMPGSVTLEAGGTVAHYRSGFEIGLDEQPADVIDELLKGCPGQIAEIGGTWKVRVGGPGRYIS